MNQDVRRTQPEQEEAAPFWRSLPIGLGIAFSLLGDLSLFATLVTQLDEVRISLAQVGILLSIHRLIRLPANPIVGYLVDRVGRRPLFLLGLLLAVVSTGGYGLVHGIWAMIFCRIGWGLAWALINVSGLTMTLDLSSVSNRGVFSSLYNSWIWVGYAFGTLMGAIFVDRLGFRPAMFVLAGLTAVALFVAWWKVHETLPVTSKTVNNSPRAVISNAFTFKNYGWGIIQTFSLHGIVQFAADGAVLATVTLLLLQRLGESFKIGGITWSAAAMGGILLAGRSVLAVVVSLIAGKISDQYVRRTKLLSISLWIGIVSFGLLAIGIDFRVIVLALGFSALSNSVALVVLPALARDRAPSEQVGDVLGKFALSGDIGSTLGPLVAFFLAPRFGLVSVFLVCLLLFVLGLFSQRLQFPLHPTPASDQPVS